MEAGGGREGEEPAAGHVTPGAPAILSCGGWVFRASRGGSGGPAGGRPALPLCQAPPPGTTKPIANQGKAALPFPPLCQQGRLTAAGGGWRREGAARPPPGASLGRVVAALAPLPSFLPPPVLPRPPRPWPPLRSTPRSSPSWAPRLPWSSAVRHWGGEGLGEGGELIRAGAGGLLSWRSMPGA